MFLSSFLQKKPEMPVFDIQGNRPGKTLLVTAGVDGDEYAGIEAAYRLIEQYSSKDFAGRLIIIPIVNMPGFMNESSHNPIDGKFPKSIFPGKPNGSSTEQIVNYISTNFIDGTSCWLDLHSGAITEGLNPFLWLHKTGIASIDSWTNDLINLKIVNKIYLESCYAGSKTVQLAKRNCAYAVAEAGQRGERKEDDIALHLEWTRIIMIKLGMVDAPPVHFSEKKEHNSVIVMKKISYVFATEDGIWTPTWSFSSDFSLTSPLAQKKELLIRNEIIGTTMRPDYSKETVIRASANGYPLWWKETMRMKKGDILCAIGQE